MSEQSNDLREQDSNLPHNDTSAMKARRSFLIKGAITAPILTTVISRPVWAGECTLSGNLSNNVSNHDSTTHCDVLGYSGGAWCKGHAENNDYWGKIGRDKSHPLTSLLPATPNASVTIGQALGCSKSDAIPKDEQGLWKQRTAAALNLSLWNEMKVRALADSHNSDFSTVNNEFFFDTTLAIIMSSDESTLKDANKDF